MLASTIGSEFAREKLTLGKRQCAYDGGHIAWVHVAQTRSFFELHRFGGVNSIRGFYENSLQASLLTSLITEYRYVLASGIYAHSIVDYGYFRDGSRNDGTGASGRAADR